MRHYHVHTGLNGYLPNDSTTHLTLADAEQSARSMADDYREMGWRVSGSARARRYDVRDCMHVEIVECVETDCELDE